MRHGNPHPFRHVMSWLVIIMRHERRIYGHRRPMWSLIIINTVAILSRPDTKPIFRAGKLNRGAAVRRNADIQEEVTPFHLPCCRDHAIRAQLADFAMRDAAARNRLYNDLLPAWSAASNTAHHGVHPMGN